ncbi:MAG: hypothetical protein INH12_26760 [Cupriavidus sp.]|jgi:hypothetical protein|uniref:hypothetical protein n=1 Tax=Cupriavidus sp. TaxID=1873897 RepID=UPI0025BA148A|nr:hypothetical protein [Cupriavidus sp.]MCA3186457.1 hypothetical protein [Cupriavidus sp.]MCA3193680.1 hypothetical protein [Cupriavidus sp.]MCA3233547.1 hypothetical protein [Cupriavidus sp.]MCA3775558.1 hypothetical protein [Cutibacterium sp.]
MKQYTFEEVLHLTSIELGAIDDPMQLAATGHISPMLVRYVIRTGQLDERYRGIPLRILLNAVDIAAARLEWPEAVGQKAPLARKDAEIEAYLDALQPLVGDALEVVPKYH